MIEAYPTDWHPLAGDVSGRDGLEIRAVLDEPTLVASLEAVGLAFDGWLDDRRTWLAARSGR